LKELAQQLRNNSTKSEIKLWNYLKGKQLKGYDFHRQKPISDYIVDFFCNKLKLVIEIDGYTHSFEETFERDRKKVKRLNELGITVLRFSDEDVLNNIEGVLSVILMITEKRSSLVI
ncbi:MAG: endonuclease domain-containing protein, partial [Nitrospirae bacterium]|nr:endonuclease domain-containing protein [Nitrospirota bacterium]